MDEEVKAYVQAFLNELREIKDLLRRFVELVEEEEELEEEEEQDKDAVREILDKEGLL